jgi:hypothetical protein
MKPTTKQRLTVFLVTCALACALTITGANAQAQEASAPVVAIDILLKPDATMVQHATAINDRLRTDYPKGFSLDASHRAHVSLAQRYVRAADLPRVYDVVAKVLAGANVTGMKLEAFKYYYIPVGDLGLQGIVVKPSAELLKLQQAVIDVVTPFALKTGSAAAFVAPTDGSVISPQVVEYVDAFVPEHSGEHYLPHVTTGLATKDYLDKMAAEPFESFTFSPIGVAVYHLGNYGTATTKLKEWDLKH